MATTDLRLDEPGSLPRPGPVGRIVRLAFGVTRAWKKWPAISSAALFLVIAGISYFTAGALETQLLARTMWVWAVYLYAHLGLAFIISGLIATPGCEMRAFHDLYSRITGNPTKEHYCPVGPLHPIDQWEAGRK